MPLLLEGDEFRAETERARGLKHIKITSRETSDLIMMGIGAFTPLTGFMTKADWQCVCATCTMADGIFWPIPITLSTDDEDVKEGDDLALVDDESGTTIATMQVSEKYTIDKEHECRSVFRTTATEHPGVAKVVDQAKNNLAGPVKVLSESYYPEAFKGRYNRPAESRKIFEEMGWNRVVALELGNTMHRSHEFLAKIALEFMDGVYIHQPVGKLKGRDIPADVCMRAIAALVDNWFVKNTVVQGGYPLEMRYAGPREALLQATFRQNYGCSYMIVGRDHAGVGDYYGPFDAQKIFDDLPRGALKCQNLNVDWIFYCYKCGGMASMKTCPHGKDDRLIVSDSMVRKTLSEGGELPSEFSRPEVVSILREYYQNLGEKT
jgi:sulfate adenylyltransferase